MVDQSKDGVSAHLAPDQVKGCELKPVDQQAHKAFIRRNEEACAGPMAHAPGNAERTHEEWMRDYSLREKLDRRTRRGGSTFQPGDGIDHL